SLTIADAGLIVNPKVLRFFISVAEELKIPYQLETGLPGSTDAARIALTRSGVPSGVISVPTRYIHSPTSMLSLTDVENAAKLTTAIVQKLPKSL
ncbi:MAG: M42 family peptidase, partial [Candidatus Bathyarchaeia archaeon]